MVRNSEVAKTEKAFGRKGTHTAYQDCQQTHHALERADYDEVWMQIKRQTLSEGGGLGKPTSYRICSLWNSVFLCLPQRKKTASCPACECRAGHAVVLERKAVTGGKGHEPTFLCEAMQNAYPALTVSQWCVNQVFLLCEFSPSCLLSDARFPLHTFIWYLV